MKLINSFIVNVQNKFFNNHRSIACKVNVFFFNTGTKSTGARRSAFRVLSKTFLSHQVLLQPTSLFPKTFSNDPYQLLRWKFFLASIGKNFLACQKKIDCFATAADKLINNNNNVIFFENSMNSVPSIASWEFTNQISTKSVEY